MVLRAETLRLDDWEKGLMMWYALLYSLLPVGVARHAGLCFVDNLCSRSEAMPVFDFGCARPSIYVISRQTGFRL
jgi:hypothetical protein